jgi:hypothetical protein
MSQIGGDSTVRHAEKARSFKSADKILIYRSHTHRAQTTAEPPQSLPGYQHNRDTHESQIAYQAHSALMSPHSSIGHGGRASSVAVEGERYKSELSWQEKAR